jgi:DNA-binding MarR family transcriptional regulator
MEFIGRYIWQISKNGQAYLDKALKKYRIGSAQHRILRILYHTGGFSQEEISNALGIDKAATAKAVKRLLREGYIERKTDEKDKRIYRVNLTEKAMLVKDDLLKILTDWQNILLKDFTAEEASMISVLIEKMAENSNKF